MDDDRHGGNRNLILVRQGYSPAIIYKRQRARYLSALRKADAGSSGALGELLAKAILDNLHRFVVPAVAGPGRLVPLAGWSRWPRWPRWRTRRSPPQRCARRPSGGRLRPIRAQTASGSQPASGSMSTCGTGTGAASESGAKDSAKVGLTRISLLGQADAWQPRSEHGVAIRRIWRNFLQYVPVLHDLAVLVAAADVHDCVVRVSRPLLVAMKHNVVALGDGPHDLHSLPWVVECEVPEMVDNRLLTVPHVRVVLDVSASHEALNRLVGASLVEQQFIERTSQLLVTFDVLRGECTSRCLHVRCVRPVVTTDKYERTWARMRCPAALTCGFLKINFGAIA